MKLGFVLTKLKKVFQITVFSLCVLAVLSSLLLYAV